MGYLFNQEIAYDFDTYGFEKEVTEVIISLRFIFNLCDKYVFLSSLFPHLQN